MIDEAITAGKVASKVRDLSLKLVKPGAKVFDIAEKIEAKIISSGCGIAFPVNISINELAAHDTAMINDKRVLKKGDVVKVDVGTHIDGFIADTARTVIAGEPNNSLVICVEKCLSNALKFVRPGEKISKVGEVIQGVADSCDLSVVKNLVGHGLGRYNVHTGVSIPNYKNNESGVFKKDELVAIEPYLTDGTGSAVGINRAEIYSLNRLKPVRVRKARELLDWVVKERNGLPFCKRWLNGYGKQLDFILNLLTRQGILTEYKVLREVSEKRVSQREDTVLLVDKPIITTK
ncbi:MAG: type II methionyl aminopeptidase [Nanoarchaeota archaeon]|nr:type II methionyl aminopeptidase [Nanoarchaeota archaeon]